MDGRADVPAADLSVANCKHSQPASRHLVSQISGVKYF